MTTLHRQTLLYKFRYLKQAKKARHWKAAYVSLNLRCLELNDIEAEITRLEESFRQLTERQSK